MIVRLIVDAVAVYRLARLVTADDLTEDLRDALVLAAYRWRGLDLPNGYTDQTPAERAMQDPAAPKLATLITCRWCAGMWLALGVVFVARRFRWWPAMADALACSAAAALLARLEE